MAATAQHARTFGKAAAGERSERRSAGVVGHGSRMAAPGTELPNFDAVRQHERIPVNIRAILHLRGQFQTTTIRDLSVGGACLDGAYGVMPGDKVVIELTNGNKFSAEARWWICGRCGIAFAEKLAESDPLLASNVRQPIAA
jgi:PilZ domain